MKSQEVNFQKSQKLLASPAWSSKQTKAGTAFYVTRCWNWMNSYWMFWKAASMELARWAVSAIFEKWPFMISPIFLLFDTRKSCVFQIFLLRSIKAYLCPNIDFDSVDFSERRPEEVISFFWCSVYDGELLAAVHFVNDSKLVQYLGMSGINSRDIIHADTVLHKWCMNIHTNEQCGRGKWNINTRV